MNIFVCEQRMLNVLSKELEEILVDILVQYPPIQNPSPNHDLLRGNCQCDIQAKLSQVIPYYFPNLIHVLNFMQFCKINPSPFWYWLIWDHPFKAVSMEWANSSKIFVLTWVSFYPKWLHKYTICPPSGWVSPWTVKLWHIIPTPTPVPTVTYAKDYFTLWFPSWSYAYAAAFTSV